MKIKATNKYGLKLSEQSKLIEIIKKYIPSCEIILYGSRAKGNYNERSDIDIVIKSSLTNDPYVLSQISDEIMESDIPYLCDIQYISAITNPPLLDHIQRKGERLM